MVAKEATQVVGVNWIPAKMCRPWVRWIVQHRKFSGAEEMDVCT